jgi:hypothetical protein
MELQLMARLATTQRAKADTSARQPHAMRRGLRIQEELAGACRPMHVLAQRLPSAGAWPRRRGAIMTWAARPAQRRRVLCFFYFLLEFFFGMTRILLKMKD